MKHSLIQAEDWVVLEVTLWIQIWNSEQLLMGEVLKETVPTGVPLPVHGVELDLLSLDSLLCVGDELL